MIKVTETERERERERERGRRGRKKGAIRIIKEKRRKWIEGNPKIQVMAGRQAGRHVENKAIVLTIQSNRRWIAQTNSNGKLLKWANIIKKKKKVSQRPTTMIWKRAERCFIHIFSTRVVFVFFLYFLSLIDEWKCGLENYLSLYYWPRIVT